MLQSFLLIFFYPDKSLAMLKIGEPTDDYPYTYWLFQPERGVCLNIAEVHFDMKVVLAVSGSIYSHVLPTAVKTRQSFDTNSDDTIIISRLPP